MLPLVTFFSVLLFFVFALAAEAKACTCATPLKGSSEDELINKEVADAKYVFSGRVDSIRKKGNLELSPVFNVSVFKVWKGLDPTRSTLQVENLDTCQVPLAPGNLYLFYAYSAERRPSKKPTRVFTHYCTRTDLLSRAKKDLELLGPGTVVSTRR